MGGGSNGWWGRVGGGREGGKEGGRADVEVAEGRMLHVASGG